MKKSPQQPARESFDGPCGVKRIGEVIIVEATQNGITTRCEMSPYNAWRIFGCLSVMLEIPLAKHVRIDLSDGKGNPPKATIGYPEPKTLGERLAQNLTMREMVRRGLVVPEDADNDPDQMLNDGDHADE